MRVLYKGDYFGEVAIVTNLKRTATIKSMTYTYCMKLNPKKIKDLKESFPHIIDELKNKVRTYDDVKMNLKRKYLKNIPWLRTVNSTVIQHILEEVNILRVAEQGFILK